MSESLDKSNWSFLSLVLYLIFHLNLLYSGNRAPPNSPTFYFMKCTSVSYRSFTAILKALLERISSMHVKPVTFKTKLAEIGCQQSLLATFMYHWTMPSNASNKPRLVRSLEEGDGLHIDRRERNTHGGPC